MQRKKKKNSAKQHRHSRWRWGTQSSSFKSFGQIHPGEERPRRPSGGSLKDSPCLCDRATVGSVVYYPFPWRTASITTRSVCVYIGTDRSFLTEVQAREQWCPREQSWPLDSQQHAETSETGGCLVASSPGLPHYEDEPRSPSKHAWRIWSQRKLHLRNRTKSPVANKGAFRGMRWWGKKEKRDRFSSLLAQGRQPRLVLP